MDGCQNRKYNYHEPKRRCVQFLHGAVKAVVPKREKDVQAHRHEREKYNHGEPRQWLLAMRRVEVRPGNPAELSAPCREASKSHEYEGQANHAYNKCLGQPN